MLQDYINIQYCYNYLTEQISTDLLLYAHIPTSLVAVFFAIYIFVKNKNTTSSSFLFLSIFFFLWCLFDLNAWFAFLGAENMMFNWVLIDLAGVLFFFFSYRFLYNYVNKIDIPLWQWISSFAIILPVFITTFLGRNLTVYDFNYCEAYEDDWYAIIVKVIFFLLSIYVGLHAYRKNPQARREILLATAGISLFLGFFIGISYFVTFLVNNTNVQYPYNYQIYGLFGMPVLIIFLGYLIVKYKAFNLKIAGAQVLISALIVLVTSQLFFYTDTAELIVSVVTLILVLIFGYFLVKSIKKEIKQREELEVLTVTLDKANERLKVLDKMKSEFVSIASHQLRSPLTSIRGYASMLAEGSYGKLPEKAQEAAANIAESSKFMAMSIEDYLNVSRIEAGNMKYELSDFNVREATEKIVDEMRPTAMKKGLVMVFRSDCNGSCSIHADIGKTRQVIMNLLDNSMKYTPKGTITVVAHDDVKAKKMYITIQDTGVGMSKETQGEVFDKFVRAKNANEINVTGTGLGLFVAKKMVTEMGGKVWAESEGEGMGSTFNIEFPLLPGKVGR